MPPTRFGIGQAVTRKEDDPILRGAGRYVADVAPARVLHAVVLRSPQASAHFRIADVATARAMAGVRLVLTGAETAELGPLPCEAAPPDVNLVVPPYPILAHERVRHVGDAIAFVVADSLEQARDAAEAVAIEWEPLPHVTDPLAALERGAPPVWSERPGNVAFETTIGDSAATRKAFAAAARTVSLSLVNQRLVTNYLDTRGVIAEYDAGHDRTTLTLSSQGSHAVRDILCRSVLKIAPEKLRVVTPDVGGGFGTKLFPIGNMRSRPWRQSSCGRRCGGSASAASISSPMRRGAPTSPRRSSRSTRAIDFSPSTSTSSPTWARTCPATRRSFRSSAP
jgi:carbon-monoxide dehydrogenase large subunit